MYSHAPGITIATLLFILLAASSAWAADIPRAPKIAFVSSASGPGKLADWPQATGQTGAAAGDKVCQTLASEAGLANPSDFVAWLSTSTDHAFCRVQGLSGTRGNCGSSSQPNNAGPWSRTDGQPFVANIGLALGVRPRTYTSPATDENGDLFPQLQYIWHGSDRSGIATSKTCQDWTGAAGEEGDTGPSTSTIFGWTGGFYARDCDTFAAHLLCLEAGGAGPELDIPEPTARLAFLTSATGTSILGSWQPFAGSAVGIEAGHAICKSLANDAGLPFPDSFQAWLSDDTHDAIDSFQNDGAFARLDGVIVADSLADLVDGELHAPINQTEKGLYDFARSVFTGTVANATLALKIVAIGKT